VSDQVTLERADQTRAPLLSVQSLVVDYPGKTRRATAFRAVDGVSFRIDRGETLALVGESGSGKTTIARTIQGMIRPTGGSIKIDGRDIATRMLADRKTLAASVQTVFQDPFGSLNPSRTVGSTVEEGLLVQAPEIGRAERRRRVAEELERVGLPGGAANRRPREFSGGQRQRIAIARAVITRPPLVICDEAVSALDLSVQAQVLQLLANLQQELGIGYLFITHDLGVVRHIAARVAVLEHGRLADVFPGQDYVPDNWSAYTRRLFEAAPVPDPELQRAKRAAFEAASATSPVER
jgi:peptide/nickel transport system ATP-binding protein